MKTKFLFPLIAALLLGAAPLFSESSEPRLQTGEMPAYPAEARSHGTQGTVVVEALVDEQGRVLAAEVVESANRELDEATLAAVQNWTFTPAMEDGQPTMKVVRIPIQFNLLDPLRETVLHGHDRALASRK
jgi:TonB family protein